MSWIDKVKTRLPNLCAKNYLFTHGNVLINDICSDETITLFTQIDFSVQMHYLSAKQLTEELQSMVDFSEFDAVLLPGRGSQIVRSYFSQSLHAITFEASRVGYKNPKPVIANFQSPKGILAVLDDVVSTGDTALAVFEKSNPKPKILAAWVLLYPRDSRLAIFDQIVSCYCVASEKGKAPVNSLSTLLLKTEIAESYASRFCRNPKDFFLALQLIKEEVSKK